jgi:uncharacterized protein (TIGR00730 family)
MATKGNSEKRDSTKEKTVTPLRAIVSPERSTSLKARESWHILGIISEFVEASEKLAEIRPAVSIFGSARTKPDNPYYQKTVELARLLSDAGFSVISGGGPGIMEAANKGAFDGPSPSVGLNILLPHEQTGNPYQNISVTFRHFFPRKVAFAKYATAFVAMPGGLGTLDELTEVLTLIQTGKGRRIPVILVESKFWAGMLDWFKTTLVSEGVISAKDLDLIQVIDEPARVVEAIFDFYEKTGFALSASERESMLSL